MKFFDKILDLLFPPECSVCHSNPSAKYSVCVDCRRKFITEGFEKCSRCGNNAVKCTCSNDYIKHTKTLIGGYSYCVLTFYKSTGKYDISDRVTEKMILMFKERGDYADFFADELSREIQRLFARADVDLSDWTVTYPPRSLSKRKALGFDQCELLASKISKKLGIPYVSLFERLDGEEQKTLSLRDRQENASSTISIIRDKAKKGGKYILLDDIITTGSTMSIAARNLYFCGADEVFPAAIAKTMPRNN